MRPEDVLARTDWTTVRHSYDWDPAWPQIPADPGVPSTPEVLTALLGDDLDRRGRALFDLHHLVHHQGGICGATAPAVRFAIAALPDPRTLAPVVPRHRAREGLVPVRAALLDWLASVMGAAAEPDERRPGFPADVAACRALRPAVHRAAAALRTDPDPAVAARALGVLLACLLDAPELAHHRPATAEHLRRGLATLDRRTRAVAVLGLQSWGHDTAWVLDAEPDPLVRAAAATSPLHPCGPDGVRALREALVAPDAGRWCRHLFPHFGPIMLFHVLPAAVDRIPLDALVPALDAFLAAAPPLVYVSDWGTRLRARALPHAPQPLLAVLTRRCFAPDAPRPWSDFDARTALADLVPAGVDWLRQARR